MATTPDQLPHPVLLVSDEGQVLEANRAAESLLAGGCDGLVGSDAPKLLGCEIIRGRRRGAYCRIDGTPVPVDVIVEQRHGGGLSVLLLELRPQDLVAEGRAILDLAFDNTPICAALFNTDGQYIRVNDNLCRMLGRSGEQLLGHRDQEFTHPEDRERDVEAARRVLQGELDTWQTEKRFLRPDGEIVWAIANMTFLRDAAGGPFCWLGQFQEITAHRRMQERLRKGERQLAEAQRIAQIGSWEWDRTAARLTWSEELCRLFGVSEPPATGDGYFELIHPADREAVLRAATAAIKQCEPFSFEHRVLRPDGTVRRLHCIGKIEVDEHGVAVRLVGTAQDVTDSRAVEGALRESEELLRAGFDGAAIGMALIGPDRSVARVNDALCRLTGYSERELLGGVFRQITHPDDREAGSTLSERALAGEIAGYEQQKRYVRPDGTQVWVHLTVSLLRDDEGRPRYFIAQMLDITERVHHDIEQAALRRIAELVARNAGSKAVFTAVAAELRDLLDAERGLVTRATGDGGSSTIISACTRDGHLLEAEVEVDPDTAAAEVIRTQGPARLAREVAAPIIVGGALWGTVAATFDDAVPASAEYHLGRFAELVAMAVANTEAWDALFRQAATDPLTGLANHRSFQQRLHSEWTRAQRYGRELSLVLLDLDHFKAVNDSHGHLTGDQVLVEVALRLSAEARQGELLARIGGEEFAWLMPETGTDGAYRAAERVRRMMEAEPFAAIGSLTISAGVCSSSHAAEADDLIRHADRALYWAKEGGRNATFLYHDGTERMLAEQPRTVERLQTMASVRALARAIDSKDPSTRRHSERVAALAERLALQLGWTSKRASLLHACGLLHDVGKIGIPDEILLRAGPLAVEEYEQVKRHAEMSAQIAAEVLEAEQVTWIRGHHERWDGTGYPDRLSGERIADGAQLLALADAWDVMTESRTYKPAKSTAEALAEVRAESGRQFSPMAVGALIALDESASKLVS
jgi:diguanylate cyclase (GGDEF)-like protein/PAS domain S-box-containing protein/putative nucleotidyltransferase with HDIG domain